MVDRGTDDGEPEGHVDRFVESEGFYGDEGLIVVHADIGVDFLTSGFREGGVGGQGPDQVATLPAHLLDCGTDDAFLLSVSEKSVFVFQRFLFVSGKFM